jgi:peptidoglycan/xylan/chitin deacetylase (PgdA/CDA1 family)
MRPSRLVFAAALALAITVGAQAAGGRLKLPENIQPRALTVPILTYHRVDLLRPPLPELTRKLTVDPGDFAAQMRWLKSHGFHTLTQTELFMALVWGKRLPSKPVLITFDDGYRDVFLNAAPVLKRLGLKATAYVITGRIGGPDVSFLNWKQLRELESAGIEAGSHTISHAQLTSLSDAEAIRQLVGSRKALEYALGHPVQWFSYPYGAVDARAVRLVRKAGYVLAVTTHSGAVQTSPLELRRNRVLDTTGVAGLARMLG